MNLTPVQVQLHVYARLRETLLQRFPDLDDETIRDTLEGATSLHELIAELVRSALVDEAFLVGLKIRLDEMRSRFARLEQRVRDKRAMALEAMGEAGLRKLEQPDFTASARAASPGVVVTAEQDVPDAFWIAQPAKLDRLALLNALKSGEQVAGAQLSEPRASLSVRTK